MDNKLDEIRDSIYDTLLNKDNKLVMADFIEASIINSMVDGDEDIVAEMKLRESEFNECRKMYMKKIKSRLRVKILMFMLSLASFIIAMLLIANELFNLTWITLIPLIPDLLMGMCFDSMELGDMLSGSNSINYYNQFGIEKLNSCYDDVNSGVKSITNEFSVGDTDKFLFVRAYLEHMSGKLVKNTDIESLVKYVDGVWGILNDK